ncbi:type II toxin-antitoxin system ParD family antitoxin [Nostoc sp. NMS7]|uniref:type II toxin-antitoxin system ParD family antitoxin n=1 Tax=Nostoc sp. NMS7 TaxID=2815391 RepID=UPI0025DDACCE|nr:type II toxin-antitoxin system ParD family antitoxin [Nostoc sp. NMS7]
MTESTAKQPARRGRIFPERTLPPEELARGKAEEVISKALKLVLEWEKGYQQWVGETREKVEVAIEQLDRGEGIDGEVVLEQLREKLRKAKEAQG